jgi:hypothetical protein
VKRVSGDPIKGRLLTVSTKITLGWESVPRTNTLTYYEDLKITEKSFQTLTPEILILIVKNSLTLMLPVKARMCVHGQKFIIMERTV